MNAIHPTNVNTDMLHSPPMYRAFRPDLKKPTREDAELVFPVVQAMPIPYVEPEDISEAVAVSRQRRARDTSPASSCASTRAASSRSNRGRRRREA